MNRRVFGRRLQLSREWSYKQVEQVFAEVREHPVRMVQEHRGRVWQTGFSSESIAREVWCTNRMLQGLGKR